MKQDQYLDDTTKFLRTCNDASRWILREISRSKYRKSFESEDHTTLDEILKEAECAGIHLKKFHRSLKALSTESSDESASTPQQKEEPLFSALNESLQALIKVTEQLLGLNCHEELSPVEKDDGPCVDAELIVEMARDHLNDIEAQLILFKQTSNGYQLLKKTKELQEALLDYPRRPCQLVEGAPITFEQLSSKLEQLGYVENSSNTDVLGYFFADQSKGFFQMALREGVILKIQLNRKNNKINKIKEITSQKKSGFSRLSKSSELKTIETRKKTITLQSSDFLKMKRLVSGFLSDHQVKQDKKAQMILDHMCLSADRDIEAVWDQAPIKALSLHVVAYCVKESSKSQEAWQPMSVLISQFFLSERTFNLSDQDYKPYPTLMLSCHNQFVTSSKLLSSETTDPQLDASTVKNPYEESLIECSQIIREMRGTSQIVSQSVEHVASADEVVREVVSELVEAVISDGRPVSSRKGEEGVSSPVLADESVVREGASELVEAVISDGHPVSSRKGEEGASPSVLADESVVREVASELVEAMIEAVISDGRPVSSRKGEERASPSVLADLTNTHSSKQGASKPEVMAKFLHDSDVSDEQQEAATSKGDDDPMVQDAMELEKERQSVLLDYTIHTVCEAIRDSSDQNSPYFRVPQDLLEQMLNLEHLEQNKAQSLKSKCEDFFKPSSMRLLEELIEFSESKMENALEPASSVDASETSTSFESGMSAQSVQSILEASPSSVLDDESHQLSQVIQADKHAQREQSTQPSDDSFDSVRDVFSKLLYIIDTQIATLSFTTPSHSYYDHYLQKKRELFGKIEEAADQTSVSLIESMMTCYQAAEMVYVECTLHDIEHTLDDHLSSGGFDSFSFVALGKAIFQCVVSYYEKANVSDVSCLDHPAEGSVENALSGVINQVIEKLVLAHQPLEAETLKGKSFESLCSVLLKRDPQGEQTNHGAIAEQMPDALQSDVQGEQTNHGAIAEQMLDALQSDVQGEQTNHGAIAKQMLDYFISLEDEQGSRLHNRTEDSGFHPQYLDSPQPNTRSVVSVDLNLSQNALPKSLTSEGSSCGPLTPVSSGKSPVYGVEAHDDDPVVRLKKRLYGACSAHEDSTQGQTLMGGSHRDMSLTGMPELDTSLQFNANDSIEVQTPKLLDLVPAELLDMQPFDTSLVRLLRQEESSDMELTRIHGVSLSEPSAQIHGESLSNLSAHYVKSPTSNQQQPVETNTSKAVADEDLTLAPAEELPLDVDLSNFGELSPIPTQDEFATDDIPLTHCPVTLEQLNYLWNVCAKKIQDISQGKPLVLEDLDETRFYTEETLLSDFHFIFDRVNLGGWADDILITFLKILSDQFKGKRVLTSENALQCLRQSFVTAFYSQSIISNPTLRSERWVHQFSRNGLSLLSSETGLAYVGPGIPFRLVSPLDRGGLGHTSDPSRSLVQVIEDDESASQPVLGKESHQKPSFFRRFLKWGTYIAIAAVMIGLTPPVPVAQYCLALKWLPMILPTTTWNALNTVSLDILGFACMGGGLLLGLSVIAIITKCAQQSRGLMALSLFMMSAALGAVSAAGIVGWHFQTIPLLLQAWSPFMVGVFIAVVSLGLCFRYSQSQASAPAKALAHNLPHSAPAPAPAPNLTDSASALAPAQKLTHSAPAEVSPPAPA